VYAGSKERVQHTQTHPLERKLTLNTESLLITHNTLHASGKRKVKKKKNHIKNLLIKFVEKRSHIKNILNQNKKN
jgi:seryl-tRNA(Sec) selenium transferase